MLLVYCDHITKRIEFIFDFLLDDILGIKYELTEDKEEYSAHSGPKFSYGMKPVMEGMHFHAHQLLYETGTREQSIAITQWKGLPVFFKVDKLSALPFDPFAMCFYLVTRYEEYLPFEADEHGRFPVGSSLASREGFLDIPLVDIVAGQTRKMICERFPQLEFPPASFRFIPTFDIDIAYAHLGKGFPRAALAWSKLFLTARFGEIRERFLTITGIRPDPYDNFRMIEDLVTVNGHEAIYFTLLGDFGRYDRNISYKNQKFRNLLTRLANHSEIGLHPSYRSHLDRALFEMEKSRLEAITGDQVLKNRFHFLRFKFPDSFRMLSETGIRDDYSLGYSSLNGFRAGTCTPFHFYDLQKEEITGLKLHPFIFMDSVMIDQLNYAPEQAFEEIMKLLDKVRKYGGEAIGIWHNYSLSEKDQYLGWQAVLKSVLDSNNFQSL